jgi:hypothetical protein
MSRTNRLAVGSNQYRHRPAVPVSDDPTLLQQVDPAFESTPDPHGLVDAVLASLNDPDCPVQWDLVAQALHHANPTQQEQLRRTIEDRVSEGDQPLPPAAARLVAVLCDRRRWNNENWGVWLRRGVCATLLTDTPHAVPEAAESCARWVLDPPVDPSVLKKGTAGVLVRRLATSTSLPPWAARRIYELGRVHWASLASNPECPPDVLMDILANDCSPVVREAALRNPSLPDEYQSLHGITQ